MRTKKEKSVTMGNRHSSATQYEVPSQSASLSELSNESVLELFEQMLVSVCLCVCVWESLTCQNLHKPHFGHILIRKTGK